MRKSSTGQLPPPSASGVVEHVDVEHLAGGAGRFQPMPDAAVHNHRPIERLAIERDQYIVTGHDLPQRFEDGLLLGVVAGQQQFNSWFSLDLPQ